MLSGLHFHFRGAMFCDLNFCDPVFVVSFSAIFTEVRIYVSTTYRVRVVYMFTLVPRVLRFNSPVFVLPFLKPFYAVPLSIGPKNKLELGRPRVISWDKRNSVVTFTDACYERDAKDLVCGLGAVLYDEFTGNHRFFSCALDEEQRAMLGERSKKQIIFEAETFCAVLAYLVWSDHLNLRNSFLYVDNEGTKYCLMKGASDNEMVDAICAVFAELEMWMQANCWLARVASFSNIADKPSRGDTRELLDSGFSDDSTVALQKLVQLMTFTKKKLGRRADCYCAT